MSDNKYSVDEILNEYSKTPAKKRKGKSEAINELDQLLDNPKNKKSLEFSTAEIMDIDELKKEVAFDSTQAILNQYSKDDSDAKLKKEIYLEGTQAILSQYSKEKSTNEESLTQAIKKVKQQKTKKQPVHNESIKPKVEHKPEKQLSSVKKENIKPIGQNSGNTEIIESILKLKKERIYNKTSEMVAINRKNIKDITLDLTSKIIPKTEQVDISQQKTELDELKKMKLLKEKRKAKIRDFVLSEEDDENNDSSNDFIETDDFSDIEDAPQVQREILHFKGILITRLLFLLVATVLSSYIVLANDFDWPIIKLLDISQNPSTYIFINIIIGLLSIFICGSVVKNGVVQIFKLNADGDSLPAISVITSVIASIVLLFDYDLLMRHKVHIFIPIGIVCLLFNTIGRMLIVWRTEKNFKYILSDNKKFALSQIEDAEKASRFTRGALSGYPSLTTMNETEFIDDFLKNSYAPDMSDAFCKKAVPIVLIVSAVLAILSIILNLSRTGSEIAITAVSTFAGVIALSSSFAVPIFVNIPFSRITNKLLQGSSCMVGYEAVEKFEDTNSVLIDVNQLFPEGSVELINLKQLSSTTIEEGILLAASLSCHSGSILRSTFYKMLKGKTEILYPVESYLYEDTLGLSGWIENKRVLLGTRELMINHSIEGLPSASKEADYAKKNLVLYLSVSGEITTMFIIKAKASMAISKWLQEFELNDITVVLRSIDSIISLNYLSQIFHVAPETFKLLPFRQHKSFEAATSYIPKSSTSLVGSGKFQSFAMLILAARRLHSISVFALAIVLTSLTVGLVVSLVLTLLGAFGQITASITLLYNLAWAVLTYLFLKTKRI